MSDKRFPGESALEALFGAIKSALSSKQNQTLSTTIAGSSTVEGALQSLEQSYSGLDYSELDNKPQINGVELSGNKTASDLGIAVPTNLSDLNDDVTHRTVSDTEKSTWNGKADTADITNAINALDVSSVGGAGKYISAISETDGKISATAETMDEAPTEDSNNPVKSGGIFNAIENSVSLKTATGNPITLTDAANANAEELLMTIEPIQDLHGYSKPWPAGGGKNLLPMTVDGIKAANTIGTWSGNTYTHRNVTFAILTDSDDNVIAIKATGTASGDSPSFYLGKNISFANGNYILNGCPANGSVSTYCMIAEWSGGDVKDLGSGISLSVSGNTIDVRIRIQQDYAITSGGITFYPMLRLSTETDATFAPYTNICPISGLTSGEVETTDGTDTNTASITLGQSVYGGSVNFKTGEVTVTHGMVDLGTLDWHKENTSTNHWRFYASFVGFKKVGTGELAGFICSHYKEVTANQTWQGVNGISGNGLTSNSICVCDETYSDAAAFKTAMSGVQLCYELATPTTLSLTPAELELLKGNNTITANGAEISIEYYPDNAIGALAGRVDDKADKEDVAVPKYDSTNRREYYEGGAAFDGDIDSVPTAGSNNAVASGGVKTYVDNAVDGVVKHVAGETSITIPLSDSWTASIFGTISVTPISAILTVVSGGSVSVTDLTSNSLASRANISANVSNKTLTITSKNTDKFYVNIVY